MPHDRRGGPRGGRESDEAARLREIRQEQEEARKLTQELIPADASQAKKIAAALEKEQRYEDAAVAYADAFDKGAHEKEIVFKAVRNYMFAGQRKNARAFIGRIQGLGKESGLGGDWFEEARQLIIDAEKALERAQKQAYQVVGEERIKAYADEEEKADLSDEIAARREGFSATKIDSETAWERPEELPEALPAGQYFIQLTHYKRNPKKGAKDSERVYGKTATIGSLDVGPRGSTLSRLLRKAQAKVGLALKDSKEPETAGKVLVEVVDSRNKRVVGEFDDEVDRKGRLKKEAGGEDEPITEDQLKVVLGSYGIDAERPAQEFVDAKYEALNQIAKQIENAISGMSLKDCHSFLNPKKGGPISGLEELKRFSDALDTKPMEMLALLLDELEAEEGMLIQRVARGEAGQPAEQTQYTGQFYPAEKREEWKEYLQMLGRDIKVLQATIESFITPKRIRDLVEARLDAIRAAQKLVKEEEKRKQAEAARFDEEKEKVLLVELKKTGFIEPAETAGAEDFVEEKYLKFELEAVPALREKIAQATTAEELINIMEGAKDQPGTIASQQAWYDELRAKVLALQAAMQVFKPGPDSPAERITIWNDTLSTLRHALDAHQQEVARLSGKLYAEAKAKKEGLERLVQEKEAARKMAEDLERWKSEIPGLSERTIAKIWGTDKDWPGDSIKNREYYSLNLALQRAEETAFDAFAKQDRRTELATRDFEALRQVALEFAKRLGEKKGLTAEAALGKVQQLLEEIRAERLAKPTEFQYSQIGGRNQVVGKEDWYVRAKQGEGSHAGKLLKGLGLQPGSASADTLLGFADFIEAARRFQFSFMTRKKIEPKPAAEAGTLASAPAPARSAGEEALLKRVVGKGQAPVTVDRSPEAPAVEHTPAREGDDTELVPPAQLALRMIQFDGFERARSLSEVRANLTRRKDWITHDLEKPQQLTASRRLVLENELAAAQEALAILDDPVRTVEALRTIRADLQGKFKELEPQWLAIDKSVKTEVWRLHELQRHRQRLNRADQESLAKVRNAYDIFKVLYPVDSVGKFVDKKLMPEAYAEFERTPEARHQRYASELQASMLVWALETPALQARAIEYIRNKQFTQEGRWSAEHKTALRELMAEILPKFRVALCAKIGGNFGLDSRVARDLMKIAMPKIADQQFVPVRPGTRAPERFEMHINTGDYDGVYTPLLDRPRDEREPDLNWFLQKGRVPNWHDFPRPWRSVFIDHHAEASGANTSSAKDMYELLEYLGFFEGEDRQAVEQAIKLVTWEDNKSHPDWSNRDSAWWQGNWRKTMLGLASRLEFSTIVAYAKDHPGTDFTAELSEEEIAKYGIGREVKALEKAFDLAKAQWGALEKDGHYTLKSRVRHEETGQWVKTESQRYLLKVPNSKFGELTVAICQGEGFPGRMDALKSLGGDNVFYIVYNPPPRYNDTFFASHASKTMPDDLFGEQGRKLRERMWVYDSREAEQYPFTLRSVMTQLGISEEALRSNPELMRAIEQEEHAIPEAAERKEVERVYQVVGAFLGEFMGSMKRWVKEYGRGIRNPEQALQRGLGDQLHALLSGDTERWHAYKSGKAAPEYEPYPEFIRSFKERFGVRLYSWLIHKAQLEDLYAPAVVAAKEPTEQRPLEADIEVEDALANIFGSAWPDVRKLIGRAEAAT